MDKIPSKRFYKEAEEMDRLVHLLCPYITGRHLDECRLCPASEHVPNYGEGKAGCRALAEEALALALEWLTESNWRPRT